MNSIKLLAASICLLSLPGCAYLTHYNNKEDVGGTQSNTKAVFIDAKQRAVFSTTIERTTYDENKKETSKKLVRAFCAEPSPDALSALAANVGLSASQKDKLDLLLNTQMAESAASIGIRTVAIQALRDITYRTCEGYAGGAITDVGLETLLRRFQSTMVSIIAIEQLTGAVRADQVKLGSSVGGVDGEAIKAAVTHAQTTSAALAAAQTEENKAKTEYTKAQADTAQKKAKISEADETAAKALIQKKDKGETLTDDEKDTLKTYDDNQKAISDAQTAEDQLKKTLDEKTALSVAKQQENDDAQKVLKAVSVGSGKASSQAEIETVAKAQAAANQQLSENVLGIVKSTLELGYAREVCTTMMGKMDPNAVVQTSAAFDMAMDASGTAFNDYQKARMEVDSKIAGLRSFKASLMAKGEEMDREKKALERLKTQVLDKKETREARDAKIAEKEVILQNLELVYKGMQSDYDQRLIDLSNAVAGVQNARTAADSKREQAMAISSPMSRCLSMLDVDRLKAQASIDEQNARTMLYASAADIVKAAITPGITPDNAQKLMTSLKDLLFTAAPASAQNGDATNGNGTAPSTTGVTTPPEKQPKDEKKSKDNGSKKEDWQKAVEDAVKGSATPPKSGSVIQQQDIVTPRELNPKGVVSRPAALE